MPTSNFRNAVAFDLSLTLSLLAALVAFNSWSYFQLFAVGFGAEAKISDLLSEGRNVSVPAHVLINERLLHRLMIEKQKGPDEVQVFGNSKIMELGRNAIAGGKIRNHAVFFGELADYLGLYGAYEMRGWSPPKTVFVLVDPELFNPNKTAYDFHGNPPKRDALAAELKYMSGRLSIPVPRADNATLGTRSAMFLSPKYSQLYLAALFDRYRAGGRELRDIAATVGEDSDTGVITSEGRRIHDKNFRQTSPEAAQERALVYAQAKPVSGLGDSFHIDDGLADSLTRFLSHLRSRGTRLVLVIPPFHPDAYRVLTRERPEYRLLSQFDRFIQGIAARVGAEVVGSVDPSVSGVAGSDFFDGNHLKESGLRKLFSSFE